PCGCPHLGHDRIDAETPKPCHAGYLGRLNPHTFFTFYMETTHGIQKPAIRPVCTAGEKGQPDRPPAGAMGRAATPLYPASIRPAGAPRVSKKRYRLPLRASGQPESRNRALGRMSWHGERPCKAGRPPLGQ